MAKSHWILELNRDSPSQIIGSRARSREVFAEIEIATPLDNSAALAAEVAEQLAASGYLGEDVLLALSAELCLAAAITCQPASQSTSRQALAYEAEHWLPWAAEETVADFFTGGDAIFTVATEVTVLLPLLEALDVSGVVVRSIVPSEALVLMRHLADAPMDRHVVLWSTENEVDLWVLEHRKPTMWWHVPSNPERLNAHLRALTSGLTSGTSIIVYNGHDALENDLAEMLPGLRIERRTTSRQGALIESTASILTGQDAPLVELQRDQLGVADPWRPLRSSLRLWGACAVVALLAFSLALMVRTHRIGSEIAQLEASQEQIFRETLRGQSVPVGKLTRLRSERDKLAGQMGQGTGLPEAPSALRLLHEVLASMPTDVRFRLHEIRLDQGNVSLDGEVLQHTDADLLARALRERGFTVAPPRTQRLSDGAVSLRLTAKLSLAENQGAKKTS